jgi:hypothetical protein
LNEKGLGFAGCADGAAVGVGDDALTRDSGAVADANMHRVRAKDTERASLSALASHAVNSRLVVTLALVVEAIRERVELTSQSAQIGRGVEVEKGLFLCRHFRNGVQLNETHPTKSFRTCLAKSCRMFHKGL